MDHPSLVHHVVCAQVPHARNTNMANNLKKSGTMKTKLLLLILCTAMSSVSCFFLPSFLISNRRNIRAEEKLLVLDGKCVAVLKYSANGDIKEVAAEKADPNDQSVSCEVVNKENLFSAYGMPVVDNSGGLTLENPHVSAAGAAGASAATASGKMICYGPPIPTPPRCICTMSPC